MRTNNSFVMLVDIYFFLNQQNLLRQPTAQGVLEGARNKQIQTKE
jgi:hypothetical protein